MLINGLPDGSALHRAANGGREWTLSDAIQWQILGQLHRSNGYFRAYLKVKKHQDKFDWPTTPWETRENQATKYGQVDPEDQEDAVNYLMSLHEAPPDE